MSSNASDPSGRPAVSPLADRLRAEGIVGGAELEALQNERQSRVRKGRKEKGFVSALKNELRDQVITEADFRAEARDLFGI